MVHTSAAFVLLSMAGAATLATCMRLESRAAQTSAVCSPDFHWMDNSFGVSPCLVAAQIDAVCNGGNWIIDALPAGNHYDDPTGARASRCTCSWASYNLISACTACQGGAQISLWSVYNQACGGLLSDTFFPSNISLAPTIAIPFWAQTNPTNWSTGGFAVAQAKTISNLAQPDFVGTGTITPSTPPPPPKKSNIGAIVGGVIGGLVVVICAIVAALCMLRRQRRARNAAAEALRPGHNRGLSDMSMASSVKGANGGYLPMTTTPGSQTLNTGSGRSVPFFSSFVGSSSPPPLASSPPGIPTENIVHPFTIPPTVDNPDRKTANGPQPIYDHPNAPPQMRVDSTRAQTPVGRSRVNPPAYTPSSPGGSTSDLPRTRHMRKQASTDTNHSLTSSRTGVRSVETPSHSPNPSGSGMANMMGQIGAPAMHGRNLSGQSRDRKRRPTDDGAGELA